MEDAIQHRRRAKHFDYTTPGAYFVTICTHKRIAYFRHPVSKGLVEKAWKRLPTHFPTVRLDTLAILPDHVHVLLWLEDPGEGVKKPTLGDVMGMFKGDVTRDWARLVKRGGGRMQGSIWQERFQDRFVRSERELETKRRYIQENEIKHRMKKEGEM